MGRKIAKKKAKSGPKPDILKLRGDWRESMRKSLQKKKPQGGWPG
jgi:hypothetical protein